MKTIIPQIASVVVAVMVSSCGSQVTNSASKASSADTPLAVTVYTKVNEHRSSIGAKALGRHPGLDRLAREHSEYMRQNRGKFRLGDSADISHVGFEERTLAAQRLMGMQNVAENIGTCGGRYSNPAATLIQAWQKSSGHAKNMRGNWELTGVGVVVDTDGTVFATQIFASKNHSHMTTVDRMRQF